MEIVYHKLTNEDLPKLIGLIKLYEEVFEMQHFATPSSHYLQTLLEKEHIIFYTALVGNEVVGGLTAHILPSIYAASGEVYLYDLAIKKVLQRKGISRRLIDELKKYCHQKSFLEIFVQADLDDQHALDFYQATGGIPERVMHYSYALR